MPSNVCQYSTHMKIKPLALYLIIFLSISTTAVSQCITNTDWEQIIPAPNLPAEVKTRHSNNNLDVIEFEGRFYVGFRTAPNHFASKKTKLYVLSTTDFSNWQYETEVFKESDLREPRFFSRNDTLFFMFFNGGKKKFRFEPNGIYQMYYTAGKWSADTEMDLPLGYVPWRIKPHNGLFYLSTYEGINEYKLEEPCETRFFTSHDGFNWKPLSEKPQIDHPRASAEAAFVFDDSGDLWGIARLEFDGSYIYHADNNDLATWETWYSPHKFDSPIMFTNQGRIFIIARRNLDGDGTFHRKEGKYKKNLLRYSLRKKTTALYQLDTENKALLHIKDFESTGDCAFPGIAQINDSTYYVLNYSSNIKKRKKAWLIGQLGKTFIYKTILTIPACDTREPEGLVFKFEKDEEH